MSLTQNLILVLVAVGALAAAAVLLSPWLTRLPGLKKVGPRWAIAGSILAAVVSAVTVVGVFVDVAADDTASTATSAPVVTVTATPSPARPAPVLTVRSPADGDVVDTCFTADVDVTGLAPDETVVVSMVEPDNGLWYVNTSQVVTQDRKRWHFPLKFGDGTDTRTRSQDLIVSVVPTDVVSSLASVNAVDPKQPLTFWSQGGQFPDTRTKVTVPVTRSGKLGVCE